MKMNSKCVSVFLFILHPQYTVYIWQSGFRGVMYTVYLSIYGNYEQYLTPRELPGDNGNNVIFQNDL